MPIHNPEDVSGFAKCNNGNYTGNNTANRAIPHGLGKIPKLVMIHKTPEMFSFVRPGYLIYYYAGTTNQYVVTSWDASNFYVGEASNYPQSANATAVVHYWMACG